MFNLVAIKRIPLSPEIWDELSSLKAPGQPFDEKEKKHRLLKDMKRVEEMAYRIYEKEKTVKILDIMTIEEAYKKYGRL